ncbi:tRNA (adenosine(37)-N6)-threonylcarbamoyltransferase complex transferase subunit TsaD [bacterium]|nr:tRNA (adenosine(37)-N6)-threonylcarbamoyltransferase complex transferase subunit TsaD [bacterium]MDA7916988.1 tRNA (adenosine(37)-N6)-threonylcarbamoyltransferase complex transferase subunit TsaD [Akkermansiaceae bacterium]MDA7936154.1 tRNA (adenosine(37)-N6)-threonylcarbamoyltransferase complex transferase subunit TsaD [bacterium]MDB0056298.1 tRNA (adenosine(37)-N6)-threonylcarbamoyltransferase complex transferase subunit TsaD [Akkermansiaceae bacterium]MDB0068318.1 tRNA (adenosine(37)-N6)-
MLLAIESSCDETAVAIIRREKDGPRMLSSLISSQIEIHREFGGVVPEVACRNHAQRIRPLVEQALTAAGVSLSEIDAFAATCGPGLASSLLVGLAYAKGLAASTRKPFYGINHMEGHLLSPFVDAGKISPHLGLIVSGGHTLLIDARAHGDYHLLGRTIDDAAGEAFDKVGRMLQLPYPGGPEIEKHAREGDPKAYRFPRARLKDRPLDFSFSGLKTAVLYQLQKLDDPQAELADICASFQEAVIESLVKKTLLAAEETGHKIITLSGGVACNKALQEALQGACEKEGHELRLTPPALTTDNAGMIAFAGLLAYENREPDPLDTGINPNLSLTALQ